MSRDTDLALALGIGCILLVLLVKILRGKNVGKPPGDDWGGEL